MEVIVRISCGNWQVRRNGDSCEVHLALESSSWGSSAALGRWSLHGDAACRHQSLEPPVAVCQLCHLLVFFLRLACLRMRQRAPRRSSSIPFLCRPDLPKGACLAHHLSFCASIIVFTRISISRPSPVSLSRSVARSRSRSRSRSVFRARAQHRRRYVMRSRLRHRHPRS